MVTASGQRLLQNWLWVEKNVFGTAIDQKPTGEDGKHLDGCRTAMWKERRKDYIMISKQQLKLWRSHLVLNFPGIKQSPNRISGRGQHQIESSRKKKEGKHTNYFVLHVGYFMAVYGNTNIEFSSFLLPMILDCYRFEWGLTKPQQKGQHLGCILMHICIPQSPIFLKKTP